MVGGEPLALGLGPSDLCPSGALPNEFLHECRSLFVSPDELWITLEKFLFEFANGSSAVDQAQEEKLGFSSA